MRGNKKAVLKRVLHNDAGKKLAAEVLRLIIYKEIKLLCSDNFHSILVEKSQAAMEHFSWESIWLELEKSAVILTTLLKCLFKTLSEKNKRVLILCISLTQNKNMCSVQAVISMVLYTGHAGKQVFELLLC